MSSNYLTADNGVSSGVTGITQSAGNDGTLQIRTTTSGGTATTAVTVDNAQNVGVGVTPSAWNSGYKFLQFTDSTSAYVGGSGYAATLGANNYINGSSNWVRAGASYGVSQLIQFNGQFIFNQAASGSVGSTITWTQAMTLDASNNLLVGQTTQSYSTVGFSVLGSGSGSNNGTVNSCLSVSTNAASSYNLYSTGAGAFRFYVDMGGTIHATSTSIAAISDSSLKTNVKDLETGLAEVMALKPRRFDWINGDATNVAGFIAQEVEQVLPELVVESLYSQDDKGNEIKKKNLKMGDILPTLVKAIQELSAQVTSLQATVETQATTIATLQNKIGA